MDNSDLSRWRALPSACVIQALSDYAKQDVDFEPSRDGSTTRWHVSAGGADFELVCTGSKFFDTRAKRGGGGAIDLVMHLYGMDFAAAVRHLRVVQL